MGMKRKEREYEIKLQDIAGADTAEEIGAAKREGEC